MTLENVVAALSFLGVGGALATYFRILWERQNQAQSHKQEFKEARYKCMILLMYSTLDFEKHSPLLRQHGRSFATLADLDDELRTEWHNMILFASEAVLSSVHAFIRTQNADNFRKAAFAMRADLWGGKISDSILSLTFDSPR